MGLDMYLRKKVYVGEGKGTLKADRFGENKSYKFDKVVYVILEVAYWRKANAIHKWFVDNVQKGEDDCNDYLVSVPQLKTLVDLCTTVLQDHSKAGALLPPQQGFFFGSTELDEYYFQDLQNTIDMLKDIEEDEDGDFYYHSSW